MTFRLPSVPRATLLLALTFALLSLFPYVLHPLSSSYEGLTVIRDKDYGNYFGRLERALSGHFREASNGITPVGSGIEGAQNAGLEIALGALFSWTTLPAPTLSVLLTPLFVFLFCLLLFALFRVLEFSERLSLTLTAVYVFLLLHVVLRVMHPGWSFVPALAALVSFFHFIKKPTATLAVCTGILLGLLPSIYLWSWTYVWAVVGSFVGFSVLIKKQEGNSQFSILNSQFFTLVIVTLLVSLPFFLHLQELTQHPLYDTVALRGGFLHTRSVESLPRSLLLLLQAFLFLSLFPQKKKEWSYIIVLSLLLGILIAMHQNLVHGTLLMFSSHFYPHLVLSTTAVLGYVLSRTVPPLQKYTIAGISLLFLAGAAYDYLPGYIFFVPDSDHYRDQLLAEPIQLLRDNGTRDTVLTDASTGRVLTSFTDEGIVYTTHTRFLFLSDEEMAERYCLSQLFAPDPPDAYRALYMEYNAVLDSPQMRAREETLVSDACRDVRADPLPFLRTYGVTHVLWNQERQPEWLITRYPLPLTVLASSNRWLLLQLAGDDKHIVP